MTQASPYNNEAIIRMADGTVKQTNLLSGTEVWTVPGRANRPLPSALPEAKPIDKELAGRYCAFCDKRYLDTPPEKARRIIKDGKWKTLLNVPADKLFDTTAELRRVPNLFEIVSYNYWHLNHGHTPSEAQHRRMAAYLSSDAGYDHVMSVVRSRMFASGVTEEEFNRMSDSEKLQQANGFFAGGHDLIIPRRHYVEGAETTDQLMSSGGLTPEEHYEYLRMTVKAMDDLFHLDPAVKYVATFQNWLRPAGASFEHLHKQLVAIDQLSVQSQSELDRLSERPDIYDEILRVGATRKLLLAQNEHAIALAGFGHRYPTVAVWPLGAPYNPWEASKEQLRGVSDILHAVHKATGAKIPTNEEWYYRPPSVEIPMRWRMLVKWRISTLAGFEGGTRIYLNTIDPWTVQKRIEARLLELREEGSIADMRIGDECKVSKASLR